jgi:hypothetical protein
LLQLNERSDCGGDLHSTECVYWHQQSKRRSAAAIIFTGKVCSYFQILHNIYYDLDPVPSYLTTNNVAWAYLAA